MDGNATIYLYRETKSNKNKKKKIINTKTDTRSETNQNI